MLTKQYYISYSIKYNITCYKRYTKKKRESAIRKGHFPVYAWKWREQMVYNTGAALLDAIVLAVVSKEEEGTYGYKITQDVRSAIDVSESTLYPVLRRLQKDECLQVYDMECGGRNRRYYRITDTGKEKLTMYQEEWKEYSSKISALFFD